MLSKGPGTYDHICAPFHVGVNDDISRYTTGTDGASKGRYDPMLMAHIRWEGVIIDWAPPADRTDVIKG